MTTTNTWLDSVQFNADGLIPAIAQDHQSGEILMMAWMNAESLQLTVQTKTAVYFSRSRGKLWHKGETSGHTQQVHDIYLDCDADVLILSVTQVGGIACHTGRKSCFYRRLNLSNSSSSDNDTLSWQTVAPILKDPDVIYGNDASGNNSNQTSQTTHHNHQDETSQPVHNAATSHQILADLDNILQERKAASADSSYVASLYHKGINKILEKVGEEAVESIIAAKDLATLQPDMIQHSNNDSSATDDHNTDNHNERLKKAQYELIYEVADVWFHTLVTLAWFNIESTDILNELARRFGLSGITEKAQRTQAK